VQSTTGNESSVRRYFSAASLAFGSARQRRKGQPKNRSDPEFAAKIALTPNYQKS
jgi:hypothetical protein